MTREFLKQPIPFPGHKHCFKDGYLTNVRPVRDNELSQETMRHIFMRYIFSFLAECEHDLALEATGNYLTGVRGETSGKGTLMEEVELQEGGVRMGRETE